MVLKSPRSRLYGCALALLLALSCAAPDEQGETVRIGLMLPYTGDLSSTSRNHERAVLFVKRQVERVGVADKRLEIVFADSHSDVERGLSAAERLLARDVAAVIGFESDELASALLPRLEAEGVVLITPSVSTPSDEAGEQPWFRVAPSTTAMAENLAKRLYARGIERAAVLHTQDQYNASFARAFSSRFERLGGSVPAKVVVSVNRQSYPEALAALGEESGIVLSAPAQVAARVVNEFYAEGRAPHWYFPPALRSESFIANASLDAFRGALGIAPEVQVDPEFAAAFADNFQGDLPFDSALFYYDAAALFVLAYEHAFAMGGGGRPTPPQLVKSLFAAAFPVGVETTWRDVPLALAELRRGHARYYRGLTGRIAFATDGERGVGAPKLWAVTPQGKIVDVE